MPCSSLQLKFGAAEALTRAAASGLRDIPF